VHAPHASFAWLPLQFRLAVLLAPPNTLLRLLALDEYSLVMDVQRNVVYDNFWFFKNIDATEAVRKAAPSLVKDTPDGVRMRSGPQVDGGKLPDGWVECTNWPYQRWLQLTPLRLHLLRAGLPQHILQMLRDYVVKDAMPVMLYSYGEEKLKYSYGEEEEEEEEEEDC
jgi:hypothetical protein